MWPFKIKAPVPKVLHPIVMPVTRWFRRVTAQDLAWVNFFIAVGIIWPLATLLSVPPGLRSTLQSVTINAWFGTAIVGAVLAVTGILMYSQLGTKWRPIGAAAELGGLILMFIGPTLFGLIYAWLYFTVPTAEVRPTVIGLAFALASGLGVRFVVTIPRFRREKNDETKDV